MHHVAAAIIALIGLSALPMAALAGPGSGPGITADAGRKVEHLIADLADTGGLRRIALVYRDDPAGRAGRNAAMDALGRRGMGVVATGSFLAGGRGLHRALSAVRPARPEAVIVMAAPELLAGPSPGVVAPGTRVISLALPD